MSARLKPLTPERSTVHQFGALLRRLRIEAGLSQPKLSAKLYTSKSTLSRAETGVRLLARDLAEACDELLGAAGTLLALWRRAEAAADSPGGRAPLKSTEKGFVPGLARRAVQAFNAELGACEHGLPVAPADWDSETSGFEALAARTRIRARRDRNRHLSPGKSGARRYLLPLVGDDFPAPTPASLHAQARSSPGVRGSASGGPQGPGNSPSRLPVAFALVVARRV